MKSDRKESVRGHALTEKANLRDPPVNDEFGGPRRP